MSKVAIVHVDSCDECPFLESDYTSWFPDHLCTAAHKRLFDDELVSIPDWCPLDEDADEKE